MLKVPVFGFTCLGFLAVCVIIAVATFLVFRSGEQGKTKLSGCAGCAIGLALMFLAGIAFLTFLFVAFLGAESEVVKRGPVESLEFSWDHDTKDDDHADAEKHGDAASHGGKVERDDTADSAPRDPDHPVHLRIELRGGDPSQVTRWLRDNIEGNYSVSVRREETLAGPRTVIDLGLPISRGEAEETRRELEEALPSLRLPSGVRIEIKGSD